MKSTTGEKTSGDGGGGESESSAHRYDFSPDQSVLVVYSIVSREASRSRTLLKIYTCIVYSKFIPHINRSKNTNFSTPPLLLRYLHIGNTLYNNPLILPRLLFLRGLLRVLP